MTNPGPAGASRAAGDSPAWPPAQLCSSLPPTQGPGFIFGDKDLAGHWMHWHSLWEQVKKRTQKVHRGLKAETCVGIQVQAFFFLTKLSSRRWEFGWPLPHSGCYATQASSTSLRTVRRLGDNSVKEGSTSNNVKGRILCFSLSESICFLFDGNSTVTLEGLGMSSAAGNWKQKSACSPGRGLCVAVVMVISVRRDGSD